MAETKPTAEELLFARVFGQGDGAELLTRWRHRWVERAFGPETSEAQLRDCEARRAFVLEIGRKTRRGKGEDE